MNDILSHLTRGGNLTEHQANELLQLMVDGNHEPALIGAVLAALKTKGESPEEVRGFATAMRMLSTNPNLSGDTRTIDIVGTGGDGSGSLNLSTGTALLTAACGLPVAKHGNRSITSRSGSADVLEALGVPIPRPDQASHLLDRAGFTFLFAPYFHPAMKALAPVRKALGVRTIFNILGPLTNPAAPPFYLIGAFDSATAQLMANSLAGSAMERAFVVHGSAGWDEATPVGPFELWDVHAGSVRHSVRDPEDIGINRCTTADLAGGSADENAAAIRDVFTGTRGPHRDALTLAAGMALELAGLAGTWKRGLHMANDALDAGRAENLLTKLNELSRSQQLRSQTRV